MLGRNSFAALLAVAAVPAILALSTPRDVPTIRPTIPTADRSAGNRVFLERAEVLRKAATDSFMVLVGDVVFTKGPMIMKCDSAHYFADTESMDAFGHVSMEQGDTLFVFADELNFDGVTEIATLYADPGKKVELINRDVKLETDIFVYDLGIDLGYYEVGGRLTDPNNTLTSLKGEYIPSTKEANFYVDVHLNSRNGKDTLDIFSDTLYYNTGSHIAELHSPSRVINDRGTIYTSLGVYDTDSSRTTLYDRSTIVTKGGQRLTADTIFYDRKAAYGEAFGNIVAEDSAHNASLYGQYGYYDELADSTFITGRAMIKHYADTDTLYLHARYMQTFRQIDSTHFEADTLTGREAYTSYDTTHIAVAYPRARFYRRDMQGICDSMRFTERDTMLRMFVNPVIWSEDQQVFGNVVELHLNDSTIETATLPDQGFTAQHIEGDHYNQISGKEMKAYFRNGEMRQLDINGNVEILLYPEESDSTINKMVSAESSFLQAFFHGRTTDLIKMWPQTTGTVTPLFLARRNMYYLAKFKWYEGVRPLDKDDIFIVPEEMEQLMLEAGRPVREIQFQPRAWLQPIGDIPAEDKAAAPEAVVEAAEESSDVPESETPEVSKEAAAGVPQKSTAEEEK